MATFRSPISNTTTPRTPTGAPLVSAWCRCIAEASVSRAQARILSVTPTAPHAEAAVYANGCTKNTYRRITRFENEATMERMANRLAARPEVMDRRRESVEHPFGSIKQWMGQGAFLTRPTRQCPAGEFSLTALAYNMRRAINLVEFPP